jgi:hypothetical protein
MKAFLPAFGVVLLAFAGLWYVGGGSRVPQSVAAAERPHISEPVTHDNLTVFFVHGPDSVADTHKVASLQEALQAGWAVVHETGDVNELAVENRSEDYELFIQEGDIIKGGQQDRVFAIDMLVPPKSGVVPFPAHCVEQGRWQGRGQESATQFNKSDQRIVGSKLAYANATRQQSEVWGNVKENQDKLAKSLKTKVTAAQSETSFQLTLENKDLQAKVSEFEKALRASGESSKHIVGVVFLVNGKITGAEVYGSNTLFKKAWPRLLRSQSADAIAERADKPLPVTMTSKEVEQFLATAEQDGKAVATASEHSNVQRIGRVQQQGRTRTADQVQLNNRAFAAQQAIDNAIPNAELNADVADNYLTPEQQARFGEAIRRLPENHRRLVEAYFRALNREPRQQTIEPLQGNLQFLQGNLQFQNLPRPGTSNQPLNPEGNRLKVNRVESAAGLVSESRDPARQNAVIHKSYIKK